MRTVQQEIADIVTARSKALHIATSDVEPHRKREAKEIAQAYDDQLMQAFAKLPDNRPDVPAVIVTPAGVRMVLQSLRGDDARYVPVDKYDVTQFAYHPTPRIIQFDKERATTAKALEAIHALEALQVSTVEADDHEELEAVIVQKIAAPSH